MNLKREVEPKEKCLTMDDLEKLKNKTPIDGFVAFTIPIWDGIKKDEILVYGTVKKKYPHIFMLDDGKTYQWSDYLIGKVM